MIKSNEIKGMLARDGLSYTDMARILGIHPATFRRKLAAGVFGSDEIEKMIDVLNIANPMDIFFARE